MNIPRESVIADLAAFCREGNGLLVGDPGIGKSWTLKSLTNYFRSAKISAELVSIDKIYAEDEHELNAYLECKDGLIPYLRSQQIKAGEKGVLMFDAFDAARSDKKRNLFLRLIRQALVELENKWTVLVSVRTFDAQKSHELIELFPNNSITQNVRNSRRFSIPPLDDSEIQYALNANPLLGALFARCQPELKKILKVPFNLWLLEQIANTGNIINVSSTHASTDLLNLFWESRICNEGSQEQNEAVLREVAAQQVKSKQLVSLRSDVYNNKLDSAWQRMFSSNILEVDSGTKNGVKFSHNILFDYAVARLLMSDLPNILAEFLAVDHARALFLRPSLVYHFEDQFHQRNHHFWENYFDGCASKHPALTPVTRLILPAVLVSEVRDAKDFQPIFAALSEQITGASKALVYLLQAIRTLEFDPGSKQVSLKYDLWMELISKVAENLEDDFAWDVGWINDRLLSYAESNSLHAYQAKCGNVARILFQWCWDKKGEALKSWNYRFASAWAIPQICRTYRTAPSMSRKTLSKVLDLIGRPGFPIDCIYVICANITTLIQADTEYTAEIYSRVFGYDEKSDEKTQIGDSVVMSLISNRRQDYEMCYYNLIESYPKYLSTAPASAIIAGIKILEDYILRRHVMPYLKSGIKIEDLPQEFQFQGATLIYIEDISHVWGNSNYQDQELKLADAIEKRFLAFAEVNNTEEFKRELAVFAAHAHLAFFWGLLLKVGSQAPVFFASALHELCLSTPILTNVDTVYSAGSFIKIAANYWDSAQRLAVENKIISLADTTNLPDDDKQRSKHSSDRLIRCFPRDLLQTQTGRDIRKLLDQAKSPIENTPPFRIHTESRPFTMEDYLREQGAEVESVENTSIIKATADFKTLSDSLTPKNMPLERIPECVSLGNKLYKLLKQTKGANEHVRTQALTELGTCAVKLARKYNDLNDDQKTFTRSLLLESADHNKPDANPVRDSEWKSPSWSPYPRTEAAQGLPWILLWSPSDDAVKDKIRKLVSDPVPAVRFLIASELFRISDKNADLMHELIELRIAIEPNQTVIDGICSTLHNTIGLPKSRQLTRTICAKMENDSEPQEYHKYATVMMVDMLVRKLEIWPLKIFEQWIGNASSESPKLLDVSSRLLEYIKPTMPLDLVEPAYKLQKLLIKACVTELLQFESMPKPEITEEAKKCIQNLFRLIDDTIVRFYFAFDFSGQGNSRGEIVPTNLQRKAYFIQIKSILEDVVTFGNNKQGALLGPTAHHLMELLSGVVKFDVNEALRLAVLVAKGGNKVRYQFDSLAIKEVVTMVECILADYRGELRDDVSFKNLVDLLDVFAAAGWPEALRLVWRLDEVYR